MSESYGNASTRMHSARNGLDAGHDSSDPIGKAKKMGEEVTDKASGVAGSLMDAAKEQAAGLGNVARDTANQAAGRMKAVINDQKSAGADYLGNIAQCTQRAATEFDMNAPQAAEYIRQAANQVDSLANAIRNRDAAELVSEVQSFARRQPALFFGGAMVLGFAALRFLKSSSASMPDRQA